MDPEALAQDVEASIKFFNTTTSPLTEADSTFAPKPEMFTVAQQIAHVARTIEWFADGPISGNPWDMEFDKHVEEIREVSSIAAAREWIAKASADVLVKVRKNTSESLEARTSPDDPIMANAPLFRIVEAMIEHTAHHRGSLAVYIRLLDKVPPVPYF